MKKRFFRMIDLVSVLTITVLCLKYFRFFNEEISKISLFAVVLFTLPICFPTLKLFYNPEFITVCNMFCFGILASFPYLHLVEQRALCWVKR